MEDNIPDVIRISSEGLVDDVIIHGDLVRLERLDETSLWISVYQGLKRTSFMVAVTKAGKLTVVVTENDLQARKERNSHA